MKELKELKKIVVDTKRELEQLRSSLTASTPQQGIDSLTRSLPAQTDGHFFTKSILVLLLLVIVFNCIYNLPLL
jgi:hypothetical protein